MFSAVIITHNAEKHIKKCITSIIPICTEIVVVDSGSTDQTIQIAKAAGARVVETDWQGYGANKNIGNREAKFDWILSIDSDEYLGTDLQTSIKSLSLQEDTAYIVRRVNFFCGQRIRFGGLRPEWKVRIFNRNCMQWNNRKVHESLVYERTINLSKLSGDLNHRICDTPEEFGERNDLFAKLTAEQWHRDKFVPSFIKRHLIGLYHFLRSYIFHFGFLEGARGLEISLLLAIMSKKKIEYYEALKV